MLHPLLLNACSFFFLHPKFAENACIVWNDNWMFWVKIYDNDKNDSIGALNRWIFVCIQFWVMHFIALIIWWIKQNAWKNLHSINSEKSEQIHTDIVSECVCVLIRHCALFQCPTCVEFNELQCINLLNKEFIQFFFGSS